MSVKGKDDTVFRLAIEELSFQDCKEQQPLRVLPAVLTFISRVQIQTRVLISCREI